MNALIIDRIAQVGIPLFGLGAMFLIARKDRRGFLLGLLSQPCWFATAIINHQWGLLVANCGYAAIWVYGFWRWYFKEAPDAFRQNQNS